MGLYLTICNHYLFDGVRVADFCKFFVLSYYVSSRSVFRVVMSVRFPHENDIRFVFTSSCL
jgi:hypothetical protein